MGCAQAAPRRLGRRFRPSGGLLAAIVLLVAATGCSLELPLPPGSESPSPQTPIALQTPSPPEPEATPSPTEIPTPSAVPDEAALAALMEEAKVAMFEGDYGRAITLWQQASEQAGPENETACVMELARAYLADKQYELAIAQLSWVVATEKDPEVLAEALGLLGSANEDKGDWRAAIESYRAYLALREDAAPYVLWRVAKAHKALGEISQQIEALESIDTARLEPSFRAEVLAELAAAYRANQDPHSALRVYEEILSFAEIPSYRALILHYQGETLREAGYTEEAIAAFYQVATQQSDTFAAYLALQELEALPEPTPAPTAIPTEGITATEVTTPTVTTWEPLTDLIRGKIYYYAQQYPQALEYLNYYIQSEPTLGIAEARYYLGLTLASQGQYENAIEQYDLAVELAGDQALLGNAWLDRAWAIGASGSDPSAFYYEFYVNYPAHTRAPEALWLAAQASERRDNWPQAAEYYGTLAAEYPGDSRAFEAGFRQGLAAYAQGDPYTASSLWRGLLEGTEEPAARARLITWMGLAAQKAGQMEQADIYWGEAARIAPEAYYGLRAKDLLQHAPPRLASGVDPEVAPQAPNGEATWQVLEGWVSGWFTEAATLDVGSDPRLAEIEALLQLGWHAEATQSMLRLRQQLGQNPKDLVMLARISYDWQLYPTMIWCAQRTLRLAQERGLTDLPDDLARLAYPVLYERLISLNAQRYDLDPLLLLAVVRQESLFSPWARSYAGALGLAQVMPTTGEWIAERLQVEGYRHDLLLRPHISLHYGAWYLDLLLGLYDRDWIAALVAYNAGPGNLSKWTGGEPIQDHDLFYETIPSQQAHDYVTYIYEHYRHYERLYRAPEA